MDRIAPCASLWTAAFVRTRSQYRRTDLRRPIAPVRRIRCRHHPALRRVPGDLSVRDPQRRSFTLARAGGDRVSAIRRLARGGTDSKEVPASHQCTFADQNRPRPILAPSYGHRVISRIVETKIHDPKSKNQISGEYL